MKLLHPRDVHEECWLLLAITKFLGLYPLNFFKSTCINYAYQMAVLIVYYVLILKINNDTNNMLTTLISINMTIMVKQIQYYVNVLSLPVMVILSVRQSSKLKKVFDQIDTVDKNIKFLNAEIDYSLCIRDDIIQVTITILTVILFDLMDYYGFLDHDKTCVYVLMWVLEHLPDFINTVIICSFSLLINKIRFRLKKVNMILNEVTKGKGFISISETCNVNDVFRLKLLQVLRFELCKTISLLNETYQLRFKILTAIYITYICLRINIIYTESNNSFYTVDILLNFLRGVLDLMKLVYVIHLHHSLTAEYA